MCRPSFFIVIACALLFTIQGCESAKENENEQTKQSEKSAEDSHAAAQVLKYGSMREAIGEQKHYGRVKFADLLAKPHFFGVAALEELRGEAAIVDGSLTVSKVNENGELLAVTEDADQLQATMLAGGYVDAWHEIRIEQDVSASDFDTFLAKTAKSAGIDIEQPFLFALEGEFTNVRLHVINGACPVHARMQKQEMPEEHKPFEMEETLVSGTLVGVYAKDAVGKLTQPATETHRHLVFADANGTKQVGHVEKGGIKNGTQLRIAR